MNGKDKISVIIPCYNVQKYIMRCFDSIYSQTYGFENLEVILIDDLSTDNTWSILESLQRQYPENVISLKIQKKGKCGGARNLGMDICTGKYITFVDADDYVHPDMLMVLYDRMTEDDYDVAQCGVSCFKADVTKITESNYSQYKGDTLFGTKYNLIQTKENHSFGKWEKSSCKYRIQNSNTNEWEYFNDFNSVTFNWTEGPWWDETRYNKTGELYICDGNAFVLKVLSGASMGTFGSLYYGSKLSPHALLLAKPLANMGNVARNERILRAGGFATSLDILMKNYDNLSDEAIEQLNNRMWDRFDSADWSQTKFIISYLYEDDYDPDGYPSILLHLKSSGVEVYGKGSHGRHTDNSANVMAWFKSQYNNLLHDDFSR